jgi:hypothetical protein
MVPRTGLSVLFALIGTLHATLAYPNFVPKTKLCDKMSINDCAQAVESAIGKAATLDKAVEAWGAWAETYEKEYRKFANAPVPPSDLDKIEEKISDKIDSYTNPTTIATDLAIKRYFPLIASVLEFADGPVVLFVTGVLSPSPLITPLQELKQTNDEVGKLLMDKIFPSLKPGWKDQYDLSIREGFRDHNTPTISKP